MEKHIVVTRAKEDSLRFTQLLSAPAVQVSVVPLWYIEQYERATIQPQKCIILTSQHAIPALERMTVDKDTTFLVVGVQTGESLKAKGFTNIRAFEEAALLLDYVITNKAISTALYLRADFVSVDIKQALATHHITVHEAIVYSYQFAEKMVAEFLAVMHAQTANILPAFSARTAQKMAEIIQQNHPAIFSNTELIAMSPAIAALMEPYGWKKIHISGSADLHSMADATMLAFSQPEI